MQCHDDLLREQVLRHRHPLVSASKEIPLQLISEDQRSLTVEGTLSTRFAALVIAFRWSASLMTLSSPPFLSSPIALALP